MFMRLYRRNPHLRTATHCTISTSAIAIVLLWILRTDVRPSVSESAVSEHPDSLTLTLRPILEPGRGPHTSLHHPGPTPDNPAGNSPTASSHTTSSLAPLRPCTSPETRALPFCDLNLTAADRVDDLVRRLAVPEKAALLSNYARAVPRLGLPAYGWWSEALHGVAAMCDPDASRCPTSFPIPTALGASFDLPLIWRVAVAISDEARALHHAGARSASWATGPVGLNYWSPTLNVQRDPRWGRNQVRVPPPLPEPPPPPFIHFVFHVCYCNGLPGKQFKSRDGPFTAVWSLTEVSLVLQSR